MAKTTHYFTTPVGRFVNGNLYVPQTKDAENKPLVIKNGPNAGQPTQRYYIAVAIPKVPNAHWAAYPRDPKRPDVESWGEAIWKAGNEAFGPAAQSPAFAWKITDGDSTIPNKRGNKPCDNEGWPGHWILHCTGSYAPKLYNSDGTQALTAPDAIKPGYYVQVAGNTAGNESTQNPGVYVNPSMVALQGYGAEIISGPDASAVGFGGAALPPGASATPVGGFNPATPPLPPGAGHPVNAPPPPGYAAPAPAAQVAVAPHPGILTPPAAPAAPFPPPAAPLPPAAPAHVMLPAAGGHTYEALVAIGWNDASLRAAGMMQ